MSGVLALSLLGSPEIHQDGIPVTGFRSNKARALLYYLAVTGVQHLRPALAGLLWTDMPETSARMNLSKTLSNLRKLVDRNLIITPQAVAFDREQPYWLDVDLFESKVGDASTSETAIEQLGEVVKLYRGDFLEGFYVREAPAFEEWVRGKGTRLRELALQGLHTLAAHFTRQGEAGRTAAIDYTTRLLALEPSREAAHRQLMLLLALSGRRSAALAQYEICCQMLADELGVEPGVETTALYERIRDGKLEEGEQTAEPAAPPVFLTSASPPPITPTTFVARQRELDQLDRFLNQALATHSRVVFITGQAGSGKTALAQEFARRAQEKHAELIVASGNCNAYTGIGDPYLPIREILGMLTGDVEAQWAAGAIDREHARRLWDLIPHSANALMNHGQDLVGSFIPGSSLLRRATGFAPAGTDWLPELNRLVARKRDIQGAAGVEQRYLFEQVTKVLRRLARERTLLLLMDDLQWADAGSISLLFHLGRRLAGSRIMVVGAYRPEQVISSRGGERHPLEPVVNEFQRDFGDIIIKLDRAEGKPFIEALVDSEPNRLGKAFRESLYRRTNGHPLFTVELLRGMQERGDLVQDEESRWVESLALDWETLPARVDAVISERIGRLPEGLQAALAVASVEGEDFTAEVVARVRGIDERKMVKRLSAGLDKRHRLVQQRGIQRLGSRRLSQYRFRHYLFQKYLYDSLGTVERAHFHEGVGRALEALYDDQPEEIAATAGQLARHFEEAGIPEKAVRYLYQAGNRGIRLSANEEAITHLRHGLELLEALPDTPERALLELKLQVALGVPLQTLKGNADPEVLQVYARARELSRQVGETRELFPALFGVWGFHYVRAELQTARELSEQLLRLAQDVGDTAFLLEAHRALGMTLMHQGALISARSHLEQAIALYDPNQHHTHAFIYGQDPGAVSGIYLAKTLWRLGYPDQALDRCKEALDMAQAQSHVHSLAYAMVLAALLHQLRREAQAAQDRTEASIRLSTEHGFAYWLSRGMILRGWALVEQGQWEEGIAEIHRGLAQEYGWVVGIIRFYYLGSLADAYRIAGRIQEGLKTVDKALATLSYQEMRIMEPDLYHIKGELLLQEGAEVEAEQCFQRAVEVAQRQGAKSLELRAVMSLCRLWQQQGKREDAHQKLSAIFGWFTEGFDTLDLIEAKALLEELST